MSRTSLDAQRSIKKYVTEFLPDSFDVMLTVDQAAWERPSAVVQPTTPQTLAGGPKVFDATRTFTIYAWPEKVKDNAAASEVVARQIEEQLVEFLQVGGPFAGAPRRIPLFDYDGIDLDEALPPDTELDGYLRVVDASTDTRRDPDDDTAWTVMATLRVTWRKLGEGKDELLGVTVQSVGVDRVIPITID